MAFLLTVQQCCAIIVTDKKGDLKVIYENRIRKS